MNWSDISEVEELSEPEGMDCCDSAGMSIPEVMGTKNKTLDTPISSLNQNADISTKKDKDKII